MKNEAISGLSFQKSAVEIRNYNDLLALDNKKGVDYRYILTERDGGQKITKIGLFRTDADHSSLDEINGRIRQNGYTNHSTDINEGRKGDYLYVVWAYL